jgi:hypothetical protein
VAHFRSAAAHRAAAFERIAGVADDCDHAKSRLVDTEARMVAVLDELHLIELACSIDGLSPVGAAAILAETGDLTRFTPTQSQTAAVGAILRQLHFVVLHRQAWDPAIAAHGTTALEVVGHNHIRDPSPLRQDATQGLGAGRAFRGIENPTGTSSRSSLGKFCRPEGLDRAAAPGRDDQTGDCDHS